MIDNSKALAAAAAAEQAAAAAQAAQDGAEVEFLSTVTRLSQITEGRTTAEATRLKVRAISVLGYDWWVKVCSNSR